MLFVFSEHSAGRGEGMVSNLRTTPIDLREVRTTKHAVICLCDANALVIEQSCVYRSAKGADNNSLGRQPQERGHQQHNKG